MRIAVVNITGGGISGGYLKYLKNMLPRLSNHKEVKALTCICPDGIDIGSWFKNLPNSDYCTYRHLYLNNFLNNPIKKMRKHLLKFSPDILFIPTVRYIRLNNIPVVNMIQNMEPYVRNAISDPMDEVVKKFIQRRLTRISVRRADQTIAVSSFVKNYITTQLNVSEKKVHRVYYGVSSRPKVKSIKPESVSLEMGQKFMFTCGSIRPARGIEDALEALIELKLRQLQPLLVIAGETVPSMKKYRIKLERFISSNGLTRNVFWAGLLNEAEMSWCYSRCSIFLMTSRIEACPNIAIEAMSHGALSIAANNPPLPEFFSDCAVYYQPGNGKSLAKSIIRMLALERDGRDSLSNRTKERSTMFSWNRATDKTIHVFLQALKRC